MGKPGWRRRGKKRARAQRIFFQQLMTAVKSKVFYLRITFLLMFRFMLGGMEKKGQKCCKFWACRSRGGIGVEGLARGN